jgi:hypothetical protein
MNRSREPRRLLYLAGPPAAGKSSLMAALTAGCQRVLRTEPGKPVIPYDVLVDPISGGTLGLELGRPREGFPGTDTMAMNVAPAVCRWLPTSLPGPLIFGEGDRLGYPGFLDAASAAGYEVTLVHVTAAQGELDARSEHRGSRQNPQWARGRATKAVNLAAHAEAQHYQVARLDTGGMTPDSEAAWLRQVVPWLRQLPIGPVSVAR